MITCKNKTVFIGPSLYAIFAYMLICIIYHFKSTINIQSLGSKSLAFATGALIWDNGVISMGSFFFRDIASNPAKYKLLKMLSHPRFALHAIGVPMQYVAVAEMGKAAGVGFLQSSLVQSGIAVVAFMTALLVTWKYFIESSEIILKTFDNSNFDLIMFTKKEPKSAFVVSAITLSFFTLFVGIIGERTNPTIARWLIYAAASAIVGSAFQGPTCNLGEVGMQYSLFQAAQIVYGV